MQGVGYGAQGSGVYGIGCRLSWLEVSGIGGFGTGTGALQEVGEGVDGAQRHSLLAPRQPAACHLGDTLFQPGERNSSARGVYLER